MSHVVLLDLVHGCCHTRAPERAPDARVFVLCGRRPVVEGHAHPSWCAGATLLERASAAEGLYRFKSVVDALGVTEVTVHTSPRGRVELLRLAETLFTALYTFHYSVTSQDNLTCPSCTSPAHTDSPAEEEDDCWGFVRQLPALGGDIEVLTSSLIPDVFGHGFSTRTGGVSSIPTLSSLNLFCSSRRRDPVAVVMENRRRLALHAGFHPKPLRLVKVDHGCDVFVVGKAEPPCYDGMVTNGSAAVLAAPGADCMPLLFADPVSKVIGVAHAGWKGTLMGVAMATVNAMVEEFGSRPDDILVAVGPSVGACCFTLERDQTRDFVGIHPDCVPDPESERPHVNIRLATRLLLQRGGILPGHIHDDTVTDRPVVTLCTSCHPDRFFSHVRDGTNFGTQVGFLWIRETGPTGRSPPDQDQEG